MRFTEKRWLTCHTPLVAACLAATTLSTPQIMSLTAPALSACGLAGRHRTWTSLLYIISCSCDAKAGRATEVARFGQHCSAIFHVLTPVSKNTALSSARGDMHKPSSQGPAPRHQIDDVSPQSRTEVSLTGRLNSDPEPSEGGPRRLDHVPCTHGTELLAPSSSARPNRTQGALRFCDRRVRGRKHSESAEYL